jgi:hypothetical protein
MAFPLLVCVIILSLVISCLIAEAVSGRRGAWAWGLLAPVGWIIAAARGIHHRQDEAEARLVATARNETKGATAAVPATPTEAVATEKTLREIATTQVLLAVQLNEILNSLPEK